MKKTSLVITLTFTTIAMAFWLRSGYYYSTHIQQPEFMTAGCLVFSFCACVGWVLCVVIGLRADQYTRCRKCRYVLRGITEPRCPECGEPI